MAFKVLTLVGTRPELIKLSRVIAELSRHVEHVLVHTGQNYDYELNEIFFQQLEIERPKHFLEAVGASTAETIGLVISKLDAVLAAEKPDAFLLLGDTNSALGTIAAKRRKIPVFHMEAGNRCFDDRVPEEINRRIVDHISDINLVYTEHARRYLLDEGLRPETVIKTGSPMREVLTHYAPKIDASNALKDLGLEPRRYFVVSSHREENIDSEANFGSLLNTLRELAQHYEWPVIVSTHPRTRKKLEANDARLLSQADERIRFMKPLGLPDYVHLQQQAACVISDSGTLTEESSICDFPAVMIRQAHERPEGMDEATVIMCGLEPARVLQAVDVAMRQWSATERRFRLVEDYEPENVSQKMLRIILSYTDYVNRTVWHK